LRVFAEPRVAEALIWLVQMTRGSPFARCWSTAPEVASYRRVSPTVGRHHSAQIDAPGSAAMT